MTKNEFIERIDNAIEDLFDDNTPHCCTGIKANFLESKLIINNFAHIFKPHYKRIGLPWFGDYMKKEEQETRLNALLLFKESVLQYQDYRSW